MPRSKAATTAAPSRANGRQRSQDRLGRLIAADATKTDLKKQRRRRGKVVAHLRSPIPHVNANALAVGRRPAEGVIMTAITIATTITITITITITNNRKERDQ
jgi:hypothetical protein